MVRKIQFLHDIIHAWPLTADNLTLGNRKLMSQVSYTDLQILSNISKYITL